MALQLDVKKLNVGEVAVLKGDQKMSGGFMMVGIGWDARKTPGTAIDADPAVVGRNAAGECTALENVCYFNNPKTPWLQHSGDNTSGEGEMDQTGDDERMWIDLAKVPADVTHIDIFAHIFEGKAKKQTFGDLSKGQIRICDANSMTDATGAEKVRIELTEDALFDATGVLFVQIQRHGPTWDVKRVDNADPKFADVNASVNAISPAL